MVVVITNNNSNSSSSNNNPQVEVTINSIIPSTLDSRKCPVATTTTISGPEVLGLARVPAILPATVEVLEDRPATRLVEADRRATA